MFDMDASSTTNLKSSSTTGGDNGTGGLGSTVDLTNAIIQGHTINDGLDAQETALLFSSIAGNTAKSVSNGINNALSNITNSNIFKIAIVGVVAFISYTLFFKKRR